MEIRERLKFILKETNPWWGDNRFRVKGYFQRHVFFEIEKFFNLRQIIALVGLRRTGKTTLMMATVQHYLTKISSHNVLYFCFDDMAALEVEDILLTYRDIFGELDFKKEKFLFCFDEVHKLVDWQEKVKRLYDTYPNVKLIISGSESLFIRKAFKETLGGRIFEFKISPLSFNEYLSFTGNHQYTENLELHGYKLIGLYKKFIKTNGFPELVNVGDDLIIHKYLKEAVVDKILFQDIPHLFKVGEPAVLREIFDIIVFLPGQILDTVKLSSELKVSRQSVAAYLDYLEKSFLVKKIYNFSGSIRQQKKSLKKYYPAVIFPIISQENFPVCFENSLVWQLDAQFFYRDKYHNEVDIILAENKKTCAIEIKSGKIELKSMSAFIKKYSPNRAVVLTLDKEEKRNDIEIMPFYKYLLKC